MGILNMIKDGALKTSLETFRTNVLNPKISNIGTVHSISYQNNKLYCTLTLKGLEHELFEVSCGKIEISPDCSKVKLSQFKANKEFLQNALEMYATRVFDVPEGMARTGLKAFKAMIS